MNAGFRIRRMAPTDLDAVIDLAAHLASVPHWSAQSWEEAIRPPHIALVASEADGVCAFAVATVAADVAELETLAIAPASRRRGLARQLLRTLAVELRRAFVTELWLEVRLSNLPAIALYRTFGFEETGRRARYYSQPIEDAALMRLILH